jgi:hypothetical protein
MGVECWSKVECSVRSARHFTAALGLLASGHGVANRRPTAHAVSDEAVYAAGGIAGVIGTGFHIYNVTKHPGGMSWLMRSRIAVAIEAEAHGEGLRLLHPRHCPHITVTTRVADALAMWIA